MAQEEIIFKVGVDTGTAKSDVDKVGDSVENVGKETKKTAGSFTSLRKELKDLTIQLQNLDPASKEFEKVAQRAGQIKEQMRGVADAINDADPEVFGGKFQRTAEGIAGAFSAVTGAQALFGQQSEEIEKQMLKVQGAIALTQGISSMKELKNDALDLATSIKTKVIGAVTSLTGAELANAQATGTMTALQKVYTFVVGASTGAMKAFRIALAATGIGAIVVLLGLAAQAMGVFGDSTDETAEKVKQLKERQQAYKDQLQKELDLLTKLRAERKGGATDLENNIRILKAKGATDKEVYDAERALIKKGLDELSFALGYKGSLNLEERNKKRQLLTDLQVLDAEYNRKVKEDQKKANEDALAKQKEQSEKLKAQKEKEAQERIDLQRKINALNIANVDDVNLREILSLKEKHRIELEELKKQYGKKKEFAEMEKKLKSIQGKELDTLNTEQNKTEQEKRNKSAKAQLEADIINAENDFNEKQKKRIELENLDYEQKKTNTELTNGEQLLLKAQHEKNLNDIAQESKDRQIMLDEELANSKKNLQNELMNVFGAIAGLSEENSALQKAYALTQLSIDTAKSISSVIAGATAAAASTGPAAPFVLAGYIASGIATVTTALSTANKILNAPSPSVKAPQMNRPTDNTQNGGAQGTQTQVNAQSTYKVVVVDSDITKMQDKTKKTQLISSI